MDSPYIVLVSVITPWLLLPWPTFDPLVLANLASSGLAHTESGYLYGVLVDESTGVDLYGY